MKKPRRVHRKGPLTSGGKTVVPGKRVFAAALKTKGGGLEAFQRKTSLCAKKRSHQARRDGKAGKGGGGSRMFSPFPGVGWGKGGRPSKGKDVIAARTEKEYLQWSEI